MSSSPSSNLKRSGSQTVRGWAPADFGKPALTETAQDRPDAEALRAIFSPPENPEGENAHGAALIKQPSGSRIRAWAPAPVADIIPASGSALESVSPFTDTAFDQPLHDSRSAAEEEVRRILSEAAECAQQILIEAELRKEEIFRKGYAEGKTEACREMAASLQTAAQVVEQINAWWQAVTAQSEPMVIELVKDTAQYIFGAGMEVPQFLLEKNFHQALQKARSLGDLKIFAHPADADLLSPAWRELQVSLLGCEVKIIPDENILRGGCYIEGQLGSIDASVQTRLNIVQDSLTAQSCAVEESVL